MSTKTIKMTDRPPIRIDTDQWKLIASAIYDGQIRCEATRTTDVEVYVRRHADGRTVVYGTYDYSSAWRGERCVRRHAGILIPDPAGTVAAIHEVASRIDPDGEYPQLADDTIGDLPAEPMQ